MPACVFSAAVVGIDSVVVEVEADITATQFGNFIIVGLPDTAVQEARERIRSAIKNSGFQFPTKRLAVNLAPADIKKQGPAYDLPIALALLIAAGVVDQADQQQFENSLFIGELALDGTLRSVTCVLPMVLAARESGIKNVFVPYENAAEAAVVKGLRVFPVRTLAQLIDHLLAQNVILPQQPTQPSDQVSVKYELDMQLVKGQAHVKRALEIAAAGGHNILLSGPPGSGKTLLAKTLTTILPTLTHQESLEVTKIYSVAGALRRDQPLLQIRPFRSPHHTSSGVALIGGGAWPKPGEISLAHRGVLFLDEFPEFPRAVLEYLRQPLEDGVVTVARAAGSWQFPASFMLVAAMNPCPCGFRSDPEKYCSCSALQINKYQRKISGPLLDRIDISVEVPRLTYEELKSVAVGESSIEIRKRVCATRGVQEQRYGDHRSIMVNAEMNNRLIQQHCQLCAHGERLIEQAMKKLGLSARSYHRVLRVARTIADIEGAAAIAPEHIAESLQYRPKVTDST